MDKSLRTNLHLWRFFTRAKQTVRGEFIYTCSAPPSPSPRTMLDKCTRSISLGFQHCTWGVGWGEAMHFETENSAFFKTLF